MPHSEESDIPRLVRELRSEAETADLENRKAEKLRLRFLVGGEHQWEEDEINRRRAANRPFVSINECEPPVNKVVNEIANNPPGPDCSPVGGGADGDTADIIAGMLRQIEYDSMAQLGCYVPAARYVTAAGRAVLEWGTEWANDINDEQKAVIKPLEDPALYYCDPAARAFGRTDAMWRIKIRSLSREAYKMAHGPDRAVLNVAKWRQFAGGVAAVIGMPGQLSSINEWTGGGSGPFWVAEFWRVTLSEKKLDLYSNRNWYSEDDTPPAGVTKMKTDDQGGVVSRTVTKRKVTKWMCDACETIGKKVEWIGEYIPIVDALGPEIWIDGKLYRLSLVHGMIDSQRALNFTASSMVEVAGLVPLSPMVGAKGQFKDSKWEDANLVPYAYLEYTPVFMADDAAPERGAWAPPPARNMWNASIDWLLKLSGFFKQSMQETSETYDESLGKNRGDQSGEAVKALQQQSQMGNFHYVTAVRMAVEILYQQIVACLPLIYDAPQAQTIIRADGTSEIIEINKDFPHPGGPDKDGKARTKRFDLKIGQYGVRVSADASFKDRNDQAIDNLSGFFKAVPQTLAAPGVAAAYLRLVGKGNPRVEQMADLLDPPKDGEETPEQLQAQLAQAQGQIKQLTQAAQQLSNKLATNQPKIEADDLKNQRDNLTKLMVAEIGTKAQDAARASADQLAMAGMAHEVGTQAVDHEHEANQAATAQQAATASQTQAEQASAATAGQGDQ